MPLKLSVAPGSQLQTKHASMTKTPVDINKGGHLPPVKLTTTVALELTCLPYLEVLFDFGVSRSQQYESCTVLYFENHQEVCYCNVKHGTCIDADGINAQKKELTNANKRGLIETSLQERQLLPTTRTPLSGC